MSKKDRDSQEKSSMINSLDLKRTTFKLGEDFYSIAYFSYILM